MLCMWLPSPHTVVRDVLWQNRVRLKCNSTTCWTDPRDSPKASVFIFDSFSLLPFSRRPLPFFHFFSPSLHLHILYLPLIICLTNPSILFSPSSVMKRASTAGGLTQYKLFPSKHCGRMTHYLWKNSFLPPKSAMMPWNPLWQHRLIYSRGWCINIQWRAQHKPQQSCMSRDLNETSCRDLPAYKWSEAICPTWWMFSGWKPRTSPRPADATSIMLSECNILTFCHDHQCRWQPKGGPLLHLYGNLLHGRRWVTIEGWSGALTGAGYWPGC